MTPDARRIIARAADILEQQGWCQDVLKREVNGKTCYCTLGALIAAVDEATPFAEVNPYVNNVEDYLGPGSCISIWNDAPGRTQAEVVAVLRAVANSI